MIVIVILSLVSIFGYATFMLHPEFLNQFTWAPPIFALAMPLFSQALILTGFIVIVIECKKSFGWRWLPFFFAAFSLSLGMELAGTRFGIPFGKYAYTGLLGYKVFDLVPLLIPLSWFFMAIPCFSLADMILGRRKNRIYRVLLAATLLITWDFTLDPAMSQLTPFWVWENPGRSILNIPLSNFAGWFVTGLLIFTAFELLKLETPQRWKENLFPVKFYAANLLLPVGMSIAGSVWLPLAATTVVLLSCLALAVSSGGMQRVRPQQQ